MRSKFPDRSRTASPLNTSAKPSPLRYSRLKIQTVHYHLINLM